MGETESEQVEAACPMFGLGPGTDKQHKHEEEDWAFLVHHASLPAPVQGLPFLCAGDSEGRPLPTAPHCLRNPLTMLTARRPEAVGEEGSFVFFGGCGNEEDEEEVAGLPTKGRR